MMNISTFINMASKIPSPGQLEGLVTFMKEPTLKRSIF